MARDLVVQGVCWRRARRATGAACAESRPFGFLNFAKTARLFRFSGGFGLGRLLLEPYGVVHPDCTLVCGINIDLLAAVELVTDKEKKTPLPAELKPATRLFDRAWEQGLIIRSFAQGIFGYAPPLCCTEAEIDAIVERTRTVLDLTLEDPEIRAVLA